MISNDYQLLDTYGIGPYRMTAVFDTCGMGPYRMTAVA
jgi:hypothetical protein